MTDPNGEPEAVRRRWADGSHVNYHIGLGSASPFIVTVPTGEIAARQAIFEISLFDGAPRVTALAGRVALPARDRAGAPALLEAGHSVALGAAASAWPIVPSDPRWAASLVVLDGKTTLGEAVRSINRYNRLQIAVTEPGVAALRPTGTYRVHDPLGFVRAIAALGSSERRCFNAEKFPIRPATRFCR
ncbi:FecR family protein [Flavisphingomonas formosensis]|uniref:hypothetical protein n=1 Tax=Flavisphingomonas formosensis TaxID=861534 RepID=UPI0012F7FC20|nr:hypothetical protein [Sphingomonas formosensis]